MARFRLARPLSLLFASLLLANCGKPDTDSANAAAKPRNLLLISIDSLRADRLGCYGHTPAFADGLEVSPSIDQIARGGAVYQSAWSSSSWTLPAHAALMTGLDDVAHGVVDQVFRIDPSQDTLAQHLSAAGYRCRGVFSGPFLHGRYGFERGFETYRSAMLSESGVLGELEKWTQRRLDAGLPAPSAEELEGLRNRTPNWDVTGSRVTQLAFSDLASFAEANRPWFLFLHYYDVHYDYIPERADPELAERFDPDYRGPYSGVDWYSNPDVRSATPPFVRRIPERDLQHVEALYDAEVHLVDRQIDAIMRRLRRLGMEHNTVVAILSDHGDEFFDHGSIGHRSHLHSELTRVPLIIRSPGRITPGSQVTTPTGFADIAPTLLATMGAPVWQQTLGQVILPGTVRRTSGVFSHLFVELPRRGGRYFEAWRDERFTVIRQFSSQVVERARMRLVQQLFPDESPAYLVYDRSQDPAELRPIPPGHPAYLAAIERMKRDFVTASAERATRPLGPLSDRLVERVDQVEQAQLEALGYASGVSEHSVLDLEALPVPLTNW